MESLRTDAAGNHLVSRSVPIAAPSFRAVLREADAPRTVWSAPQEATVVGSGAAATLTADGADRFDAIREAAETLFASGDVHAGTEAARPRLFGGFAFHGDSTSGPPWEDFPGARFVFPRVQVTWTDGDDPDADAWLTVNAVGDDVDSAAVEARLADARERIESLPDAEPLVDPPGVSGRRRTTARADWTAGVGAAVDRIKSGDLKKVVLAQALDVDLEDDLSLPDVLSRLGQKYPDCYRFLIEPEPADGRPQPSFFGATPERLVSLAGREVRTEALAGSIGRGTSPDEDATLEEALRDSGKDQHEHALVVEAIRDQLAPYAERIDTGEQGVRRLASVQHLHTPITADLAADEHILSLVDALHPTPAVGGLPPAEAQSTIREIETFDRGWYAAPVGWFDADGEGTFAVSLRSALTTDRTATLFAGAGIVADSAPDDEWDEVQLKYRPILDALDA